MLTRKKRLTYLFVTAVTLICLFCIGAHAYDYPNMPYNWQDLKVTIGTTTLPLDEYPDGSYWSPDKGYMTAAEASQYGITTSKDIYLRGWQCVGFARYAYTACFYKYPQNATIDARLGYDGNGSSYAYVNMGTLAPGYTASQLKALITSCQPGAVMRVSGHSMMIMAIFNDGLIIYDANFSDYNEVDVRKYTWQGFVDSLGSRGIEALHMPTYYPGYSYSTGSSGGSSSADTPQYTYDTSTAGNYIVRDCSALNVRTAPTTASAKAGSLMRGTIITVLGSNGGWYAITYNNRVCWVSSDYLMLYGGQSTVTFDANGGYVYETSGQYEIGSKFAYLPTPVKEGSVFAGWFANGYHYTESSPVPNQTSLTLTAMWSVCGFDDVFESDWYSDIVIQAYDYGLISPATSFYPTNNARRYEMVTMLGRAYEQTYGLTVPAVSETKFVDVSSDAFYLSYLSWANATGLVNGVSETEFNPYGEITREQIVTILYRYAKMLGLVNGEYYTNKTTIYSFWDLTDVNSWALNAMSWAVDFGIINGSDGYLNPQNSTTRCEMTTMLVRFMKLVG